MVARLTFQSAPRGLACARRLLTRVGDEQMGRFIREQLVREGVSVEGITTDKERLTALVLLSVEDEGVSPMIFVRTDCADMALSEEDVDESFRRFGARHRRHRHAFLAAKQRGCAA